MTTSEAFNLKLGLYFIHWSSGGSSVAAVGEDGRGKRWYAPTNWITDHYGVPSFDWGRVRSVELITTQEAEQRKRRLV